MESEQLNIFDDDMRLLGTRNRAEVHTQGFWHQTFHVWFLRHSASRLTLLFQLRSAQKRTCPNTLDITAAGHLLVGEEVMDGLREVNEELGVTLAAQDLYPVGIIKDEILRSGLIDREFCHVYFYVSPTAGENFVLQADEVAGIIEIAYDEFAALITGYLDTVTGNGYLLAPDGTKVPVQRNFTHDDFCPHSQPYYTALLTALRTFAVESW